MTLLQNGEEARAEALLSRILEARPGNATAKLLLAQIRQPPEELLGERFEEIEVRPGDSLSAIAGRTIDNELLFYSLARLNDIEVPRLLRPGQKLRVPATEEIELPEEQEDGQAPSPDASVQATTGVVSGGEELQETANRLLERGAHRQAYSLLLSAARGGKLEGPGDALLARAAVAYADAACREDDPDRAIKILDQASPWLGQAAESGDFARQRDHVDARLALGRAEHVLARGDHEAAFQALMEARGLTADLRQTHGPRLARLESALGEHYHDSAVSAWRDQQVDRSVELWDRVLRIDPDFEPAIRYLERARQAQRELEALEDG
jgi:tetratricopeptide (TPR) repeat protein